MMDSKGLRLRSTYGSAWWISASDAAFKERLAEPIYDMNL